MVKLQQLEAELKESINCYRFLIDSGLGTNEELREGKKIINDLIKLRHDLNILSPIDYSDLV